MLVIFIGIVLRVYRISSQSLWLDEIYSVQISRQGLFAILQNSLRDPHPPFYYILQMLSSGIWNVQTEWGWRWLSAFWGIITIPAFYLLCRRFTGRLASTLAALTLAISPFHIYYSQEARYFIFITFLTVWSTILLADLLSDSNSRSRWFIFTVLSLIGLYTSYSYLLIIGVQGLILLIHTRQREWWLYALVITVCAGIAALMILPTIQVSVQANINAPSMTIITSLQSLAGEPVRFVVKWQHWLLIAVVVGTALLGVFSSVWKTRINLLGLYFSLQLILPIIFLVILDATLDIRLPKYETLSNDHPASCLTLLIRVGFGIQL